MSVDPGTRVGPYEIIGAIGAGGMGEVYRAKDTKLGREVAVKVLPAEVAMDAERVGRFRREAHILAALNHPNIAAIYGLEESAPSAPGQAGVVALVMELVEGEDLAARLREGAIPVEEATAIGRQIAEALEEAHEHGIVHRDLKPANIKVTPDGKVKVLDFGLAKAFEGDTTGSKAPAELSHSPTMSRHATEAGMILGTAAYMSPEQARGKAVDKRSDIWAFGVVLFEMLSGQRLFAGETVSDTLAAVLRQEVDWSLLPKDVSPSDRRLIERCLERDPKKRLRDIGEARLALGTGTAAAARLDTVAGRPAADPGPVGRRGSILSAVALVAVLAGVFLGRATAPVPFTPRFTQRTFVAQNIFNARFMPDGRTIVFSAALSGTSPSLFESRPDTSTVRAFGPPRTHLLSVSKSGELAVLTNARYLSQRLMAGSLARMTTDGAPRVIAEDVREADWLPDGSDLAVIRDQDGRDQLEFPIGRVVYQAPGYLSDPRVSPDGTRVAFMEHPSKFDDRGFVKVVDRAGKMVTVAGEYPGEETLAWSPDGRSVLFAGGITYEILAAPAGGGGPARNVFSTPGSLYVHDINADGTMAITREDGRVGVVARGAGQPKERDLTPQDQAWRPRLSADGKVVLFGDGRGGHDYSLVLRNVDGSPPVTLGDGNPGDLSPDGRWATATIFSTGQCVAYPTGAGASVPIAMGPLQHCQDAIWFPDGQSVLIRGNEAGKGTRAYRAAFPGGTPEAVLPEGLTAEGISRSGKRLLVQDAKGSWQDFEIGGAGAPVKGLLPDDSLISWEADETTALVADTVSIPALIYEVRLDTGRRTKVGELAPADPAGLTSIGITAWRDQGRQYAYNYARKVSTLYLVEPRR